MLEEFSGNQVQPAQQVPVEDVQEKLLRPDEVNELIRTNKEKAYKKGYQQAVGELQKNTVGSPEVNQSGVGQQGIDPENMRKMISEEMQNEFLKKQQEQAWQNTVNQVIQKVNSVKSDYPDYDDVTNRINFTSVPHVISYVNQFPNSGDMLYDLSKNPSKLASVASAPDVSIAMAMLHDLSSSIDRNKAGKNINLPPEPLTQSTPSAIGVDNGTPNLKDFKQRYRA